MTQLDVQPCPHCGADNPIGSTFCARCGKALPAAAGSGPRVVTAGTAGASSAGRQLLSDELRKKLNKASGALLAVAIIQAVLGPVMLFMMKEQAQKQAGPGQVIEIQPIAYVMVFGIAGAFFGLWAWSRVQPYVAAIVGLVLFVSIWLLDVIADPTQIARGIILKVIIIAVLVKAIQAGGEYRKLLDQQRREQGIA
jgi:peptidoglycan/LPS O-acetylase OafA/YrhL